MNKITKAVFPVAGLGTRFLPATKACPKEMLPIVDKPLIQYAVEEALEAGVSELIFVTSSAKRSIEDYFDRSLELEAELERQGKFEMLALVRDIVPKGVSCFYVRQTQARGLGHAVLCAKPGVGNQHFAVMLPDELIDSDPGVMSQLVSAYEASGCSQIGVKEVPPESVNQYGIVSTQAEATELFYPIDSIIEKPEPQQVQSNLAVVGRYILSPNIFDQLEAVQTVATAEVQLTDAISGLLQTETVFAHRFSGKRYDCGNKLEYLKASVEFGLKNGKVGADFLTYLKNADFLN